MFRHGLLGIFVYNTQINPHVLTFEQNTLPESEYKFLIEPYGSHVSR
jgi:hypothetical protein